MSTIDLPVTVKEAIRKFRFKSNKADVDQALVIKVDKKALALAVDEELSGSVEEIAEELPENAPRYVVLSHALVHKDGRRSSPLLLLNWAPTTSPTELMMLHTSGLPLLQGAAECQKVLDCRDGSEGLTTEFVNKSVM